MNLGKSLLVLAVFWLAAAGCQNSADSDKGLTLAQWSKDLAHHNFVLKSLDGRDFIANSADGSARKVPNLSFGSWPHVSGLACNKYSGQADLADGRLRLKEAARTVMMCSDNELNEFETVFHQMMSGGAEIALEEKVLTLKNKDHILVYELSDYVS